MAIRLPPLPPGFEVLNTRAVRRTFIVFLAFFLSTGLILGLVRLDAGSHVAHLVEAGKEALTKGRPLGLCTSPNETWSMEKLRPYEEKFANLLDDKFTITMQTYQRPKELNDTLTVLTSEYVLSLLEIVVIWNEIDGPLPEDYDSKHGTHVRFRLSPRDSLNEKLVADAGFKTKAILLSDDDVYYHPKDLDFVFQTWRKFGQNRLVGALARCSMGSGRQGWEYTFCSNDEDKDSYSMILTNLAFTPIAFLDYYSSEDPTMVKVREYVDKHFNCEDIALNYMASMFTRQGPLLVKGHERYHNAVPSKGISTKPGHLEARTKCLNDLAEIFHCMPLVNETAHIERGVIVM